MDQPIISFNAKTAPGYYPSILFHSYINGFTDNHDIYSPRTPEILKYHPGQIACALAQEIRIPLGHINLSIEMLESLIDDNDLKMYLDIISRNSARIDNLIKEFLLSSQVEEVRADKCCTHHGFSSGIRPVRNYPFDDTEEGD